VLIFRDGRKRREAEWLLERERHLLDTVTQATDVMLVYLDRDFNFLKVNAAYAATCGMPPEEMVGKNHFALYPHVENERSSERCGIPARPCSTRTSRSSFLTSRSVASRTGIGASCP
jgi:PAS domain S-box-containing protein